MGPPPLLLGREGGGGVGRGRREEGMGEERRGRRGNKLDQVVYLDLNYSKILYAMCI